MSRPLAWSNLIKGVIILGIAVATALAILMFARIGALRGETITLYMATNAASRVIGGTEVWLGGQKVGAVNDIRFRSASSDTTERILIEMQVLAKYAHLIRKDSDVQIRPGSSLIGEPVIYITVGNAAAPPVHSFDTLRARAQIEGRKSRARMIANIGDSIVSVARLTKQVLAYADTTGDEIREIRRRTQGQVADVKSAIARFTDDRRSRGSLHNITTDSALKGAVKRIAALTDSIRHLTQSSHTSIGRLQRDSTLVIVMQNTLATVDTLHSQITRRLTLSAQENAALRQELDRVQIQLDSLVQDAKRNPLKYLSL
jgi:hypothetical protein